MGVKRRLTHALVLPVALRADGVAVVWCETCGPVGHVQSTWQGQPQMNAWTDGDPETSGRRQFVSSLEDGVKAVQARHRADMGVKERLPRVRETPEYAQFVRRAIRAHGRRCGGADPEDLAELVEMSATLAEAIGDAVTGLRANGFSWAQIGRALGMSRQAAQQRFGERHTKGRRSEVPAGQVELWA